MHPKSFVSNFWGAVQTMWNSAFLFVFSKQIVTPIPLQPK